MNKEEIEELKDFTIDLTDIDELTLGLEVCSKKSNMVIQEFANLIIELQQENQSLKEELKAVNKGLRKVLSKRKKWKYRYYKEKRKNSKALKYIEDKIQKSFNADWGLENSRRSDRLFTETVIELQIIKQILKGGCENGDN